MKKLLSAVLLLSSSLALTGCDSKAEFVGAFQSSGTSTATYTNSAGQESVTQNFSGPVSIIDGPDWDIVIPALGGKCMVNAEVKDGAATVRPNTTCTVIEGRNSMQATIKSGTVTRVGRNLQVQVNANVIVNMGAENVTGSTSETMTLTRVSK